MTGIGIGEILLIISCSIGIFVGIAGITLLVLLGRRGSTNQAPSPPADQGPPVSLEQNLKVGDAAGGDLFGTYPSPEVTSLRGYPISSSPPTVGQVLVWNGTEWEPSDPP